MARFVHLADVHLGGWKQEPMQKLNFQSFVKAINRIILEKPDFALFSGDLFDSAYPSIETLKETFAEFKKLYEAKIPVFLIAGSHDYSVSGKTFLDVLEKAGFCKNITDFEEKDDKIILNPTILNGVAIFGYPGKKSGLEIRDLRRIKLNDAPGLFKIFMLHTTIDKVVGTIPMDSIKTEELPAADYYALGHIHIDFQYENFVYPGPVFPNNFKELEDLESGSFYLVDTEKRDPLEKIELKIKEILPITIEISDATTATDYIIDEIKKHDIRDKIILLRVKGNLEKGQNSDIKFLEIEEFVKKEAYFILKNTHDLKTKEIKFQTEIKSGDIEKDTISGYSESNPSDFNHLMPELISALSIEKQEDEKVDNFNKRLLEDAKKILEF